MFMTASVRTDWQSTTDSSSVRESYYCITLRSGLAAAATAAADMLSNNLAPPIE